MRRNYPTDVLGQSAGFLLETPGNSRLSSSRWAVVSPAWKAFNLVTALRQQSSNYRHDDKNMLILISAQRVAGFGKLPADPTRVRST